MHFLQFSFNNLFTYNPNTVLQDVLGNTIKTMKE